MDRDGDTGCTHSAVSAGTPLGTLAVISTGGVVSDRQEPLVGLNVLQGPRDKEGQCYHTLGLGQHGLLASNQTVMQFPVRK